MTVPTDSLTPLVLLSDVQQRINAKWPNGDVGGRVLSMIIQISQGLQGMCRRRFDEYIETRYYTPTYIGVGGDLYGLRELRLDADLKSYATITNGDASAITPGNVTLLPLNSAYKNTIRLNPYGVQFWYHAGVTDPIGSISVNGTWGWGGQWINTGATVQSNYSANATALVSSIALAAGATLKIDSEYQYVSAVGGPTNTVTPAFNGSAAANHAAGAVIYRWQTNNVVQKIVIRLLMMALEQDAAPLFGQQVIGDLPFPITVDSVPKDVIADIRSNKLIRTPRLVAV